MIRDDSRLNEHLDNLLLILLILSLIIKVVLMRRFECKTIVLVLNNNSFDDGMKRQSNNLKDILLSLLNLYFVAAETRRTIFS